MSGLSAALPARRAGAPVRIAYYGVEVGLGEAVSVTVGPGTGTPTTAVEVGPGTGTIVVVELSAGTAITAVSAAGYVFSCLHPASASSEQPRTAIVAVVRMRFPLKAAQERPRVKRRVRGRVPCIPNPATRK